MKRIKLSTIFSNSKYVEKDSGKPFSYIFGNCLLGTILTVDIVEIAYGRVSALECATTTVMFYGADRIKNKMTDFIGPYVDRGFKKLFGIQNGNEF